MRIHFIAIGGAIMHYLAIAIKNKGHEVSGSDDHIFDPAKSNLEKNGLLPNKLGFFADNISANMDAIVLGMHARKDNPELLEAQKLGLKIYSFPEYIYENSKDKQRIVIAGSHGKTSITSMIMHVLKKAGRDFDYLVGSQLKGFEGNVRITQEAKEIIIEGDEYLSSAIHPEPKFLSYKPQIALLSGIAWDHINVFPVYSDYVKQFSLFAESMCKAGILVYNSEDPEVNRIANEHSNRLNLYEYSTPKHEVSKHQTFLVKEDGKRIPLRIFGKHNLQNLQGARRVCNAMGIGDDVFDEAISDFEGAANRLTPVQVGDNNAIYKDFAHSPSKLKATIKAMKDQYPDRKLTACMELHTYSSLNKNFLEEYRDSMNEADQAIVYYSPEVVALKKLPAISPDDIKEGFCRSDLNIIQSRDELQNLINKQDWQNRNLLMMSSGDFGGTDIKVLADQIIKASLTG